MKYPKSAKTKNWESEGPRSGYVGCQSCGEPVYVLLPFVGCVFCVRCSKTNSGREYSIGTEDFTPRGD